VGTHKTSDSASLLAVTDPYLYDETLDLQSQSFTHIDELTHWKGWILARAMKDAEIESL
jgi:hypothetical protein